MFNPILFLSLSDFKTIKLPQSGVGGHMDPALISLGIGIGVIGLVFFLLYVLFLLWSLFRRSDREHVPEKKRRKGSPRPDKPRSPLRPVVLIDGSNVMHWKDNAPSLAPLVAVIHDLDGLGYAASIVFDANAGWKLFGKYLSDRDFSQLLGLRQDRVLVVPKGTQADPFLLETARDFNARIVTNDRFRDWAEAHPKVKQPGFLIRSGYRANGKLWLDEQLAAATEATA